MSAVLNDVERFALSQAIPRVRLPAVENASEHELLMRLFRLEHFLCLAAYGREQQTAIVNMVLALGAVQEETICQK